MLGRTGPPGSLIRARWAGWSGVQVGQGPLAMEGGLPLDIGAGAHRVPCYTTADGAGLPTQPVPV